MSIQWIAASMAEKELIYYCFGDAKLEQEIRSVALKFSKKSAGKNSDNDYYSFMSW
jgi:Poly (ADP-ribose) glycohydrolase (PARG)